MKKITIVDAPCGAGKTSWAVQVMDADPDRRYVYCTPFLDEIDRIMSKCKSHNFKQPQNWERAKIDDFNDLLEGGEDVAVTHTTFLNATTHTMELIAGGNYTLIIDEAPDVVQEFNKTHIVENNIEQQVGKEEIRLLLDGKFICIKENGKICWIGEHYDGKFGVMEELAKANRLYWVKDMMLLCIYPPEMFKIFDEVYILTYLLNGSSIRPYLEMFDLEYTRNGVAMTADGVYALCPHTSDVDLVFREMCRKNIHVCNKPALLKDYEKREILSKQWYTKRKKSKELATLRAHTSYFFRSIANVRASDLILDENGQKQTGVMWTCYSEFEQEMSGSGYTEGRRITKEEKRGLSKKELEDLKSRVKCFVPCNARASNKYRVRKALAYLVNMNYPVGISRLFDNSGIPFDKDAFAVSCLIQWICRSRIRDGQPIELYLPSGRMRRLYQRWLDGEFSQS